MAEMPKVCHVDVDHYKRHRADPKKVTKEVDSPELRLLYCRDALNEAFCHFDAGASAVVMDEVYPYHSVRAQLEALCAERQVQVLWVEVRSLCGTAVKRLSTPRPGHLLTPECAAEIHRMCAAIFEAFPAGCQNHVIINNEDGADINRLVTGLMGVVNKNPQVISCG
jgi:hypothetical protein